MGTMVRVMVKGPIWIAPKATCRMMMMATSTAVPASF
jgi:hypothetical protein